MEFKYALRPVRTRTARWAATALLGVGWALWAPAVQALQAGDLAFTSLNADEDGWSVVALVDVPIATTVFFTDNAWTGQGFTGGEGVLRWDSGAIVLVAGTVVRFSRIDSALDLGVSAGRLQRDLLAGSTAPNVGQTGDTLYAYLGVDARTPTDFLAAISTAGFEGPPGVLDGTGLVAGQTATLLPTGTEFADYAGPRDAQAGWGTVQQALGDSTRWTQQSGLFAQATPASEPFLSTPIPETHSLWLALLGVCLLAAATRLQGSERTMAARWVPLQRHTGLVSSTVPA